MAKILFVGDVVGKGGRRILRQVLPQWKEKYRPDVVVVNVENLAHGKGVTLSTMSEIDDLGIDVYTGGNHIFNKAELNAEVFDKYPNLIRPANFGSSFPGHGYFRFAKDLIDSPETEGRSQQFLVLSLNAQVFMENQFEGKIENPFLALDSLLSEQSQKGDIILVDFHSEATSEKIAFGWHASGKVTAVIGTHTHVPTADARVLSGGTAYLSDAGMTGARDGVIGVKRENVMKKFLDPQNRFRNEPEEDGVMQINGALVEIGEDSRATNIVGLHEEK